MWRLSLVVAAMLAGALAPTTLASEGATPSATPAPLDEATLRSLGIRAFGLDYEPTGPTVIYASTASIDLQPGESMVLVLGVLAFEGCGPMDYRCFTPVPVDARWSVSPPQGAAIDAETRVLTIAPETPNGSVFTVRAGVESGRRQVETKVYVYTPEGNPFVGIWSEQAQVACGNGAATPPERPIEELTFAADGTFTLTWIPFESYVDYWGMYAFDLTRGTVEMTITGGNSIPSDFDGHGRSALDEEGRLLLTDLWLGAPPVEHVAATPVPGSVKPPCGHRFVSLARGS